MLKFEIFGKSGAILGIRLQDSLIIGKEEEDLELNEKPLMKKIWSDIWTACTGD